MTSCAMSSVMIACVMTPVLNAPMAQAAIESQGKIAYTRLMEDKISIGI